MLHRGAATEIEEIHRYIYAGGKLLRETVSDGTITKTLDFNYDNVGMPYSLIYNDGTTTTTYYYISLPSRRAARWRAPMSASTRMTSVPA